jgi:hypothetical protein
MKKYLLMPIIFGVLSFVKLEAAPMDAYYCFSTSEDASVVEKMDNFMASDAAKGLPSVTLWAMLFNGQEPETHCVVQQHPNGASFQKAGQIFQSQAGQDFLNDLSTVIVPGLEGAGTPMLNFGDVDFEKNPFLALYNVKVKDAKRYGDIFSDFMNSADLPGSATLYQDTFTGVENRTHYIVMSGPSLDALMDGISSTLNSDNGQKFQKRASSTRRVLSTNLMLHIKTWN